MASIEPLPSPDAATGEASDTGTGAPAGLLRRLGALLYDTLLLLAIFMIATALFLPFTGGEALTARGHPWLEFLYRAILLALLTLYYGIAWTRRGQTLGMASWRIRIEREDGARLDWTDTVRRIAAAAIALLPAGLGFLWVAVDPQRRAWHDRWSRTRVIVVPKVQR
jgi:uncharacterized RDD family membrane protein YckC